MRQATALGFKLVVYLVIFGVTLPVIGPLMLPQSMILAAVLTLLLWLVDLVILPRFGNSVATVIDAGTLLIGSLFILFSMGAFLPNPLGVLVGALIGTAFEWWFHRWLLATALVE